MMLQRVLGYVTDGVCCYRWLCVKFQMCVILQTVVFMLRMSACDATERCV